MGICWVIQQGHQKLPQLQGTPALIGRSLSECSNSFLLDVSWGTQETGVESLCLLVPQSTPSPRGLSMLCLMKCHVIPRWIQSEGMEKTLTLS